MEAYNSSIKLVRYLPRFTPIFTIFGNVEISNYETRKYSRKIGLHLPYLYDDLNSIMGVRVINNVVANFQGLELEV